MNQTQHIQQKIKNVKNIFLALKFNLCTWFNIVHKRDKRMLDWKEKYFDFFIYIFFFRKNVLQCIVYQNWFYLNVYGVWL